MAHKTRQQSTNNNNGLAINNTRFRRFITLLGPKTTARFYRYRGVCVPISKHLIVKSASYVDVTEAATLQHIAEYTLLPVSKVWCSVMRKRPRKYSHGVSP